jgi:hypothetical protein
LIIKYVMPMRVIADTKMNEGVLRIKSPCEFEFPGPDGARWAGEQDALAHQLIRGPTTTGGRRSRLLRSTRASADGLARVDQWSGR